MNLKYASMPRGIGAYAEAMPLSGKVPPIVIDLLVIPGTACGACPRANAPGSATVSAAPSATTARTSLFMLSPPCHPGTIDPGTATTLTSVVQRVTRSNAELDQPSAAD